MLNVKVKEILHKIVFMANICLFCHKLHTYNACLIKNVYVMIQQLISLSKVEVEQYLLKMSTQSPSECYYRNCWTIINVVQHKGRFKIMISVWVVNCITLYSDIDFVSAVYVTTMTGNQIIASVCIINIRFIPYILWGFCCV